MLGTAEAAFPAVASQGLHAAVQGIAVSQLQHLRQQVLLEGTMPCNTVYSCGPAVHCQQQVPALRECMA